MNRRELLKHSAAAGLAAGLGSLCGRKATAQASTSGPAADTISRLSVPSGGKLPAAFVLGKDAEVLDFCGPLEVFAGAATKDGTPLFAPYTVAATSAPVIVRGNMKVVPDYDFKSVPQPKVIVIRPWTTIALPKRRAEQQDHAQTQFSIPGRSKTASGPGSSHGKHLRLDAWRYAFPGSWEEDAVSLPVPVTGQKAAVSRMLTLRQIVAWARRWADASDL